MSLAVRHATTRTNERRPYFDSEHGPIHLYLDLDGQLEEAFDDAYFHAVTWAHLAAGGAGSGMRWPFRDPHTLTAGMRATLRAVSRFADALDWSNFSPETLEDHEWTLSDHSDDMVVVGCRDPYQGLCWLWTQTPRGHAKLVLHDVLPGRWQIGFWDPSEGRLLAAHSVDADGSLVLRLPSIERDLVVTLRAETARYG